MVAQAGQSSDWPVSDVTGTANLVWATTKEFRSSGGGFLKPSHGKDYENVTQSHLPAVPHSVLRGAR